MINEYKVSSVSGIYVFDMDEVLVDISPSMYSFIRQNWREYSFWLEDRGPLTPKQIFERDNFYLNCWLLNDKTRKSERQQKILNQKLISEFFQTDIYKDLSPTAFAQKTLMNKVFMDHVRVEKVYILTRSMTDEMTKSKQAFIKKWFNHPKIELLIVEPKEKKSDVLKKHKINWNLFVDDELTNIADFVKAFDIKGKEFLIPSTGYNKLSLILDVVIREKGGIITYFDKEL
jgi:hypothetical protein